MTWPTPTVPTPEQLDRRRRETAAEVDPGDRRLRGATLEQIDRASSATTDLLQTHLSEYGGGACR